MKSYLFISILAALFFLPFLGQVHLFDWDEINFAEASREMLLTGEYLRVYIDFQAFWEKPPLFFWLQALSMKLFGVNEYAARFPNAICGILSLLFLFKIGKRLFDEKFGQLWALIYLGSLLPHLYFKSGIIDPWFNLFIFSSLYYFILFIWKKDATASISLEQNKWNYLALSGLLTGLAILTKGPAALIIIGLCFFVYWCFQKFRFYISVPQFIAWMLFASIVPLLWFGIETIKNGPWFVKTFIAYQYRLFSTPDAGHGGFLGYHFVVLLIGCFPASVFAIRSFFKVPLESSSVQSDFIRWMKILFWVVLILFSIVESKIVHYSSLAYFPLTFLASYVVYEIAAKNIVFAKWIKVGLGLIASLFSIVFLATPLLLKRNGISHLIKDPFAKENLKAEVLWTGWEILPGLFLIVLMLYSFYLFRKRLTVQSFQFFFIGTAIFISSSIMFYVKRVEGYSQRAAIEFLKTKVGEDCYVIPSGYKSYAHLFYTKKQRPSNEKSNDRNWLLTGNIDKDVYLITKINKLKPLEGFEEIDRKNGFVFLKREKLRK